MNKKTLENCTVIKEGIKLGAGSPVQYDNQCEGYSNEEGCEPIARCKRCDFNTSNND